MRVERLQLVGWEEVPLFETVPTENCSKNVELTATVAEEIFEHWVNTFWTGRGTKPVLSDKRMKLISKQIKLYPKETLLHAITGCSLSDWHTGNNPTGTKYTSLELILRDSEHIERFENIYLDSTTANGFLNDHNAK